MGCGDENLVIPEHLQTHSFWVLYPGFFILCVLLTQHIKRRRRGLYAPLMKRQMSSSPKKAHREKTDLTGISSEQILSTMDDSVLVPALPSACDVLQPLSTVTSLPNSGHVAALGRQQAREKGQTPEQGYAVRFSLRGNESSDSELLEGSRALESNPLSRPETSSAHPLPYTPAGKVPGSSHDQTVSEQPLISSSSAHFGSFIESHEQNSPNTNGSDESQSCHSHESVRRLSQTTQMMHDVDEQGARSWKRLIIEYR